VVVQHQFEERQRTTATVVVTMSCCEDPDSDVKYAGLQVDYVELLPFTGGNEGQSKHS